MTHTLGYFPIASGGEEALCMVTGCGKHASYVRRVTQPDNFYLCCSMHMHAWKWIDTHAGATLKDWSKELNMSDTHATEAATYERMRWFLRETGRAAVTTKSMVVSIGEYRPPLLGEFSYQLHYIPSVGYSITIDCATLARAWSMLLKIDTSPAKDWLITGGVY